LFNQAALEALHFQKLNSERASTLVKLLVSVILQLRFLKIQLEINQAHEKELVYRVMSLKGLVDSMVQQLQLMNKDSRDFFSTS